MDSSNQDSVVINLVKKCVKQDSKAQEQLYKHFYGYGMSVCYRYSVNESEAIEVYNDTFMKVFKNLEKFEIDKSFKSWFRRILINTAINHIKSRLNKKSNTEDYELEILASSEDPSDNLNYEALIGLIQKLTPAYKSVFNLYVIDGYNHEEISDMLDISVGASKSNLSRAKAKLREMIINVNNGEYERVG